MAPASTVGVEEGPSGAGGDKLDRVPEFAGDFDFDVDLDVDISAETKAVRSTEKVDSRAMVVLEEVGGNGWW